MSDAATPRFKKHKSWMGKDLTIHISGGDRRILDTDVLEGAQFARFVGMGFLTQVKDGHAVEKATQATGGKVVAPPKEAMTKSGLDKMGGQSMKISTRVGGDPVPAAPAGKVDSLTDDPSTSDRGPSHEEERAAAEAIAAEEKAQAEAEKAAKDAEKQAEKSRKDAEKQIEKARKDAEKKAAKDAKKIKDEEKPAESARVVTEDEAPEVIVVADPTPEEAAPAAPTEEAPASDSKPTE